MRAKPIPPAMLTVAIALRVEDACGYLGIGRSKIYQLIQQGKLTSHKPGGRTTLLRADLDAFAKQEGR